MVKDPDRLLSLAYARVGVRPKLELAFLLDEALAAILRSVREPMIARIRLAWWREQLEALAAGTPDAPEPLLTRIGQALDPAEIRALADLPDAWMHLLEDPLGTPDVARFSTGRGGALATVFHDPALTKPLAFWSLVDFVHHCSDPALAQAVHHEAMTVMPVDRRALPAVLRVLVGLAADDLRDVDGRGRQSPGRVLRALRHALFAR